jgi:hypothetical protein
MSHDASTFKWCLEVAWLFFFFRLLLKNLNYGKMYINNNWAALSTFMSLCHPSLEFLIFPGWKSGPIKNDCLPVPETSHCPFCLCECGYSRDFP